MPDTQLFRALAITSMLAILTGLGACSAPKETGQIPATPTEVAGSDSNGVPEPNEKALGESLLAAVAANDGPEVRRLLDAGAPANHRGADGRPVLVAATRANAIDAARELMAGGADVNAKDSISDSAFLYAGAEGLNEILKLAIGHGADVSSTNRYGGTALIPACEHGHVETVGLLLAAGVEVDHVNNLGWTCLLEAVILGDGGPAHQEVIAMALAAGANPGLGDADGTTALEHARKKQQSAVVRLLESAGPPR